MVLRLTAAERQDIEAAGAGGQTTVWAREALIAAARLRAD